MRKARSDFHVPLDYAHQLFLCRSEINAFWPSASPKVLAAGRDLLLECAEFAGIRVLAFSINPKSFYCLVEVPLVAKLSNDEMIARIEKGATPAIAEPLLQGLRKGESDSIERAQALFGSITALMKRFKHRFSFLYHQHMGTKGNLWAERYTVSVVERGTTAQVVTGWLEHSGVREGGASKSLLHGGARNKGRQALPAAAERDVFTRKENGVLGRHVGGLACLLEK
jgi:REP element-mobilizing transposase RayT